MLDQPHAHPGREAVATSFSKQLLLGLAIVATIMLMWAVTTGPKLVDTQRDITTTVPNPVDPVGAADTSDTIPVRTATVQTNS